MNRPKFTRRHYIAIADALHEAKRFSIDPYTFKIIIDSLSNMLIEDNNNFSYIRFKERAYHGKPK